MSQTRNNIEWQSRDGRTITVACELALARDVDLDGVVVSVPDCSLHVQASVSGLGVVAVGEPERLPEPQMLGGVTAVAIMGRLALTEERYQQVTEMIAEVKRHPAYVAHMAQLREVVEREIRQAERARRNGLCPNCGTYCDGDCQA